MSLDEDDAPNPLSGLVKLVSKEGSEFIISRECAMASGTIRAMLTGNTIQYNTIQYND